MARPSPNLMLLLTLAIAAGIVITILWRVDENAPRERIGFQDADFPLPMPESGVPDHRFQTPSAWQIARIPTATRFDPPLGSEHGALAHKAIPFKETDPQLGLYQGDALDGIGGGNTDLGDPVFSTADGLVLFAGEPSLEWGKTAVIAHRTTDGRILHSMLSHLDRIEVAPGSLVPRGRRIGTVGTANGHHPARLHFEIRTSLGVDIGTAFAKSPLNRLDPSATVAALRNAAPEDLSPSPLARALERQPASWTDLDIKGAEHFPGIPGGDHPDE